KSLALLWIAKKPSAPTRNDSAGSSSDSTSTTTMKRGSTSTKSAVSGRAPNISTSFTTPTTCTLRFFSLGIKTLSVSVGPRLFWQGVLLEERTTRRRTQITRLPRRVARQILAAKDLREQQGVFGGVARLIVVEEDKDLAPLAAPSED